MEATAEHTETFASPHEAAANKIVNQNMLWAAGVGIFPIPVVDFVGITAVQLKMINDLANLYGIPFRRDVGKSIVASLIASLGAPTLAFGTVGSILKGLPLVGPVLGGLALPGFSAALTYAIGRVFIQHFETGGNMLDFDVEGMRAHFAKAFEEGKEEAAAAA